MRRPATTLHIPQPCAESWDAMSPTAAGRHCAACAKTVVDFTLSTDAEILAFLGRAAAGRTCGRFAAGQLARPLQRAVPAAPTARWRAWLAATVTLWAVREGVGTEAKAQARTEWRARYWGGPVPVASETDAPGATSAVSAVPAATTEAAEASFVIRGVVRDSSVHMGLPGLTVLLKGTPIGISTDKDGFFELAIPAQYVTAGTAEIQLSYIGYVAQSHKVAVSKYAPANRFYLKVDTRVLMGEVITCQLSYNKLPPAPWHPRALYGWGKYWVTRPFRRF